MEALKENIDAAMVPDYLRAFLDWSQKKRQERLSKLEQKKAEDLKKAQSLSVRTSIATPLRPVVASHKASQAQNIPYATPSAKLKLESRIQATPAFTPGRDLSAATPSREDLLKKWKEQK